MKKRLLGTAVVFLLLPLLAAGQDKSKKAYELIYEDIQVLKKQLMALEARLAKDSADIQSLSEQVRQLQNQVKTIQQVQTDLQEGIKSISPQYQVLLDKVDQVNQILARISEDLLILKGPPSQPSIPAEAPKESRPTPGEKKQPEQKKELPKAGDQAVAPLSSLSPQDVYNTAYADYLQGNFDLAIDGFKIYRDNFPESPLADNALFWIGECYFSQKKFEAAIEQLNDLILNYPQSDKIAATYLKKGLALAELGRKEEALMVLKLLLGKYPLEEEARIAQAKIKDLVPKDERRQ
ncbi:MAG: tol-pal system protein YbgF [Clostridiales bacterium]|nr:tol-pal system protein YbgF [Clostridiales bacterium]